MQNKQEQKKEDKRIFMNFMSLIILASVFGLGWMCSSNKQEPVSFTKDEIETISGMYEDYGDDIIIWKDKKGNVVVNIGR